VRVRKNQKYRSKSRIVRIEIHEKCGVENAAISYGIKNNPLK
jgi:hypothetical protein